MTTPHLKDIEILAKETLQDGYKEDEDCALDRDGEDDQNMLHADSDSKDGENQSPRRSNRKREATVIHVKGGHTIKKQNNYVLKGGSYVYGLPSGHDEVAPKPAAKKPRTDCESSKVAAKPRQQSEHEVRRLQGKKEIEHAIHTKKMLREAFLKQHLSALAPFIDHKVHDKIQNIPRTTLTKALQVAMQPDAIQAELRDYQLEGLQFMARMHACNMGMILGDEMVRYDAGPGY